MSMCGNDHPVPNAIAAASMDAGSVQTEPGAAAAVDAGGPVDAGALAASDVVDAGVLKKTPIDKKKKKTAIAKKKRPPKKKATR
jgi:hypothetical protein